MQLNSIVTQKLQDSITIVNDCWISKSNWSKNSRYAKLYYPDGKRVAAHRYAYVLATNDILLPTDCVLHSCDNPRCVNPAHLRKGTQKDNCQDREIRQRSNRPVKDKHYAAKLSEHIVKHIREEYAKGGVTLKTLASRYFVHISTIHAAIRGTKWKKKEVIVPIVEISETDYTQE